MGYESVLKFWFEETKPEQWFDVDPAFDAKVKERFGRVYDEIVDGGHAEWAKEPRGALAMVIVLDQFSRNLKRGTPAAFAQDARALALAEQVIAGGDDVRIPPKERAFLYLPFEHAEDRAMQKRSVELFTKLGDAMTLDYAKRHRDIIERFGRFPHRNAILGRESTKEETEFLKQPNSSF